MKRLIKHRYQNSVLNRVTFTVPKKSKTQNEVTGHNTPRDTAYKKRSRAIRPTTIRHALANMDSTHERPGNARSTKLCQHHYILGMVRAGSQYYSTELYLASDSASPLLLLSALAFSSSSWASFNRLDSWNSLIEDSIGPTLRR